MRAEELVELADRIESGLESDLLAKGALEQLEERIARCPGAPIRLTRFRLTLTARGVPAALRSEAAREDSSRSARFNLLYALLYHSLVSALLALALTFLAGAYPGAGAMGNPTAGFSPTAPRILAASSAAVALLIPAGAILVTSPPKRLRRGTLVELLREALLSNPSLAAAVTALEATFQAAGGSDPRLTTLAASLLEGSALYPALEELSPPLSREDLRRLSAEPSRAGLLASLEAIVRKEELSGSRRRGLLVELYPLGATLIVGTLLFLSVVTSVLPIIHGFLPPL